MFDIGWTELLLIGIVALIVVGPKELPGMFRKMGQFTGKARAMARDFQRAMETAADESGVKDIQRDIRKMTSSSSLGVDDLDKSIRSGLNATDFTKDWTGKPLASAQAPDKATGLADKPAEPATKTATKSTAKPAAKTPAAKTPAVPAKPAKKAAPRQAAAAAQKPDAATKPVKPVAKAAKPAKPARSRSKAGSAPE